MESGPLAVWLVVECGFGEEAQLVLIFVLYVEALRVCSWRVFVVDPCALDDACALVGGFVRMVDPVVPAVRERDGGAVCERNCGGFLCMGRLRVVSRRGADRKSLSCVPGRSQALSSCNGSLRFMLLRSFCFWLLFCVSSMLAVVAFP